MAKWLPASVVNLAENLEMALKRGQQDAMKNHLEQFQSVFSEPRTQSTIVDGFLQLVLDEESTSGDEMSTGGILTILQSGNISISLIRQRRHSEFHSNEQAQEILTNFGANCSLMLLAGPAVDLQWYELTRGDFDVLDGSLRVEKAGTGRLEPNKAVYVDGAKMVPWFVLAPDSVMVLLSGPMLSSQFVSISLQDLKPLGASKATEFASIICTLLALSGELGASIDIETCEALAHHSDHYVRWSAIKRMGGIDGSRALELARKMAIHDPHPHIRRAALKTIEAANRIQ
jgi:hypothetical protein